MVGLPSWDSLSDLSSWGWEIDEEYLLGSHPRAPPAPPAPAPPPDAPYVADDRMRTVVGPVGVLAALVVSVAFNAAYGRQLGDVTCRWRLPYSPDRRVFRIWTVIYLWFAFSAASQLAGAIERETYAAQPWTNTMVAYSWVLCGAWTVFFSGAANADRAVGVALAAFVLASAAFCALGAVAVERSWHAPSAWRVLGVGVPYSLFAGWLCVAAVLNAGTAARALRRRAASDCAPRASYSTWVAAEPEETVGFDSWVPLSLAVLVSIGAFLLQDPVLPVPALIGTAFTKGHLKNWMALELLALTIAACALVGALGISLF